MRIILPVVAVLALSPLVSADEVTSPFEDPVRLEADGMPIAVESPGFAAPTFVDVDGDKKKDLVVGQFAGGKMHLFRNVGTAEAPRFAEGDWIKTGDREAVVPGVW